MATEGDVNQGIMLGLSAIAETLLKMDTRLSKAEEKEEQKKEEEEEELEKSAFALEKASLIKEITEGVLAAIKQGGMEVEGKEPKSVGGRDAWPIDSRVVEEGRQVPVTLRTDTKEVQKPIQAMQKHMMNAEVPVVPEEEEIPPREVPPVPPEEDGSAEYPEEEDKYKEYPEQMKSLAKELIALKKSVAANEKSRNTEIQKGIEVGLQKLGYKKEMSTRPINKGLLGVEDISLMKSEPQGDVTDQLATLTWSQLAALRMRIEAGQTEGVPKELLR